MIPEDRAKLNYSALTPYLPYGIAGGTLGRAGQIFMMPWRPTRLVFARQIAGGSDPSTSPRYFSVDTRRLCSAAADKHMWPASMISPLISHYVSLYTRLYVP